MSKRIVIDQMAYANRLPRQLRPLQTRLVFSLAAQFGWDIGIRGQRWDQNPKPVRKVARALDLSDQEWAMLMGHTPS